MIGEKALSKKGDPRMKNLFFSVFIFCIKYTSMVEFFSVMFIFVSLESSKIIPYYYGVIRNLIKILNTLQDNTNILKELMPMIQGLLETFL